MNAACEGRGISERPACLIFGDVSRAMRYVSGVSPLQLPLVLRLSWPGQSYTPSQLRAKLRTGGLLSSHGQSRSSAYKETLHGSK